MNKPLVYYFLSLIFGITFSYLIYSYFTIGVVITTSFFLILFFTVNRKLFTIVTLFFLLGFFTFKIYFYSNFNANKFYKFRITEKKIYKSTASYKGKKIQIEGDISKYKEGENLLIRGNFSKETNVEKGILGTIKVNKSSKCSNDIITLIYQLKEKIYKKFSSSLGKEKAGIVNALCFGNTKYLTDREQEDFKNLGVIHAISVSGLHIGIIYKLFEGFFGVYASILICFIYIIFTGLKASAIRAFVMIVILKLSKKVFKSYDSISALSLAGIIILIFQPYYVFNKGFHLSFLATLGILMYYKKITRLLYKLPEKLNSAIGIMISVQIFVMPYSMVAIKSISLGSFFSNILLVPMYSIIVILGNIALMVMYITPFFKLINYIIYTSFILLNGVTNLTLKVTPPLIYTTKLEATAFVMSYISFLMIKKGHKQFKNIIIVCTILIAIQNYNFFPKIEYVRYKEDRGVVIRYKSDNFYLCKSKIKTLKEEKLLKNILNVDKIIEIKGREHLVKIKSNMYVKNINGKEDIALLLYINENKILFMKGMNKSSKVQSVMNSKDKYAIIELPKVNNNTWQYLPQKQFSYIIIGENPILLVN